MYISLTIPTYFVLRRAFISLRSSSSKLWLHTSRIIDFFFGRTGLGSTITFSFGYAATYAFYAFYTFYAFCAFYGNGYCPS